MRGRGWGWGEEQGAICASAAAIAWFCGFVGVGVGVGGGVMGGLCLGSGQAKVGVVLWVLVWLLSPPPRTCSRERKRPDRLSG